MRTQVCDRLSRCGKLSRALWCDGHAGRGIISHSLSGGEPRSAEDAFGMYRRDELCSQVPTESPSPRRALHWAARAESQVSLLWGQKGSALLQVGDAALQFSSPHSSFALGFPSITSLKPSFSSGSGAISCLEERDAAIQEEWAAGPGSIPPCSFVHLPAQASSTPTPPPRSKTGKQTQRVMSSPQGNQPTGQVSLKFPPSHTVGPSS